MAALDTTVKFFDSSMTGAPAITNTAGCLIALLDACLVNGFGLKTCDSVTVSDGVATANISTGHSAYAEMVVSISGATPAGLNGEHKVISTTTTTVVFDAFGVADGTATGTITLKLAPAGWTKAFSGTNLAAYKSPNVQASGSLLRLDDSNATDSRPSAYSSMTDINTGTDATGQYYFPKATASAGNRGWWMVANDRMVYIGIAYHAAYQSGLGFVPMFFGDIAPKKTGDAYRFVLGAQNTAVAGTNTTMAINLSAIGAPSSTGITRVAMRPYTGVGVALGLGYSAHTYNTQSVSGGSAGLAFPNPEDAGVLVSAAFATEGATIRGRYPGIFHAMQSISTTLAHGSINTPGGSFNRKLRYLQTTESNSATAGLFFDITGPWET